ncbi:hypothetical protein PAPHI01_2124 [Pancytospora philotis]|nr:hypothetical protein PAPHI01_2124 [Pancytospora philotis]
MRGRPFLHMFMLTEVLVNARLSTTEIASALEEEYGAGEYVDPEGPLNIMRGHPCVNNGMIAKQRKYAALMRLAYSCAGNGDKADCTFARNAHEDEVREFPADSEAMVYLSEHYRILKSMFTVENDVVVVDRSPGAPFCNLRGRERVELFAALLVLAGGADIRLSTGGNCIDGDGGVVSLVVYDAAAPLHVLSLESADRATLAVVEFFVKYGGNSASRAARYGLHYTDSPSFLLQAYVCEFISNRGVLMRVFRAVKEIVAKLPACDPGAQPGPRFFTTDMDYARGYRYVAGYSGLAEAEIAFSGVQPALLEDWPKLDCSSVVDPKGIVSVLLKLCYCLSTNPAVDRWNDRSLHNPEDELQRAFRDCASLALEASCSFNRTGAFHADLRNNLMRSYDDFLALARAKAWEKDTTTDCSSENLSAVPATEPKDFLVVLARVLGESEEKLQSLQKLLNDALSNTSDIHSCYEIGNRVDDMLRQLSSLDARARYGVCTATDGSLYGSLWLTLKPESDDVNCSYVLRLLFKPEKVEILYVSQEISLDGRRHDRLVSALRKRDTPCSSVRRFAHVVPKEPGNPSLLMLIQESIERVFNPAARRLLAEAHIAEAYAAEDPLACHIAISCWMAHTPMQSLGEAVKAGDQLLPALEDLLAQCTDGSDPARLAPTADSPVVALLDNILGSASVADDTLRPFIACGLWRCVGGRTDLFPSIFPSTDAYPRDMRDLDTFGYEFFLFCCTKYDIPEILIHHAELRARGMIQAAGSAQGPWDSEIYLAVGWGFKLRYDKSIRSFSGTTPDACHYGYNSPAFIDAARRAVAVQAKAAQAAGSARDLKKSNFCADAANLCAAAEGCFQRRDGNSSRSLNSETFDVCYYRYSVFALISVATDPKMHRAYCFMLQYVYLCWDDTSSVTEMYVLLQNTFRKLPRPGPLSPELVAEVFLGRPTVEEIKSLLHVFAIFARSDRDYCGLCSVFCHYRDLLSSEYACEFVEMLKERDDACRKTLRTITFHKKIHPDERHALSYPAFRNLLVDCIGNKAISALRILERVQDLMGVKDLMRKKSWCIIC